MSSNALIIYGRLPGEEGKSRIKKLSPQKRKKLKELLFLKIKETAKKSCVDVFYAVKPKDPDNEFLKGISEKNILSQKGNNLGEGMFNSMEEVKAMGYEKIILAGTDIPLLNAGIISDAFKILLNNDWVLGPAKDGGYYLIGTDNPVMDMFDMEYSNAEVFKNTCEAIENSGKSFGTTKLLSDLDTDEDITELKKDIELGTVTEEDISEDLAKFIKGI